MKEPQNLRRKSGDQKCEYIEYSKVNLLTMYLTTG